MIELFIILVCESNGTKLSGESKFGTFERV